MTMKLTTLANGLRVASRFMPGGETAGGSLHAGAGSRYTASSPLAEIGLRKGAGDE